MIKWDCGAGPEVSTQHRKPADSTSTWSFYRQYAEVALVLEGGKTKKSQGLIFLNLSNFHPNAFNWLWIWNLNIISLIIASCASPPWRFSCLGALKCRERGKGSQQLRVWRQIKVSNSARRWKFSWKTKVEHSQRCQCNLGRGDNPVTILSLRSI